MQDHADILQQRIQVAPVRGGRNQPLERVRGEQHEGEKTHAYQPHHSYSAGHEFLGQMPAEARDRDGPPGEDQQPEQHRALVPAPDAGDAVLHRERRVGIRCDIEHRKIVADERVHQRAERDRDKQELPQRGGAPHAHPREVAACGAHQRENTLRQSDQQGKNECEMADFGDHQFDAPTRPVCSKTATTASPCREQGLRSRRIWVRKRVCKRGTLRIPRRTGPALRAPRAEPGART